MIKKGCLYFLFLFTTLCSHSQNDTLRILFLGNSYTNANNLALITQNLASAASHTLLFDSNTPGGHTLEQHSFNSTSLTKIMQGNWDFVVLQEQSQIPTINYYRDSSMYPAAKRLNDTIKKYNPCANVVMYMTWGRRFGGQQCDQGNLNCSPVFTDFSHMQDSLELAYSKLAHDIDAYISPVGVAWKKVIEDTTLVLHTADNSHPNYSGSYLAACVFHSIFWNESTTGLNYTGSLSNARATYLQQAADSVVFHANKSWNLDVDDVRANFSFNTFLDSVQFNNLSIHLKPANFYWNFGDGNTSIEENPSHTYTSNNTFTVSLVVEYCSTKDTITQTLTINSTNIIENNLGSLINIYPNPVESDLEVTFDKTLSKYQIEIVDLRGVVLNTYQLNQTGFLTVNLNHLTSGLYFLKLRSAKSKLQKTLKVLKR